MADTAQTVSEVVVTGGPVVDDVVSIEVNGKKISGWTDVRITARAEGIPNDFDVGLTATNPDDGTELVAYAGQPCTVRIGTTRVIRGFIDRDTNAGNSVTHRLGVIGRGACADLVDCAAEWPGGQISGASATEICSKLAEPYGITVYELGIIGDKPIPQFNLNYGETAQEIIDRVCTYSGLLYYEDADGNLVLANAGTKTAVGGLVYGQNVQAWSVVNSMDKRFSDYLCSMVSVATFVDTGDGGNLFFRTKDPNVPRHRLMYLIAESVTGSQALCELRALWEAARRAGRGTVVSVTADSWRDAGGTLWTPNTQVQVTVPGLRSGANTTMIISEVSYIDTDETGKVAELTLMPPEAFAVEPIQIQPTPLATHEDTPAS